MADDSELDRLDPEPVTVKLSTGFAVDVVRLRTRQLFRLLKILTHGAGQALMSSNLDFSDNEQFATQLVTMVVMSIPDAETEAIAFLQSMCEPHGQVKGEGRKLSKAETEANGVLWDKFAEELFNPLPEDTLDLIEVIVRNEAPELAGLGKRLSKLWETAQKMGVGKEKAESAPEGAELSLEPSQKPSTSSPASTGGPTTTSSPSPSAGSDSASRRRRAAAPLSS